MKVKRIVVGPLEENCYILNIDNNYLIIDPGDESKKILNEIKPEDIKEFLKDLNVENQVISVVKGK